MEFLVILVAFRQWEKRPKMKKNIVHSKILQVFGCQSIENTAKQVFWTDVIAKNV